ncbi:3-oxo-5a-steroid 4- dehydrogenase [Dinochytrium kinnereticum]|nr:3-oxo-5a-steroid 4- dehydrogenase [Dinochytrium kinnereticum]
MHVRLVSRSGKELKAELDIPSAANDPTVDDLSAAIARAFPKWNVHRQRLTAGEKVLEKGTPLASYGIGNGDTVTFKDLGPQIGWTTVFLIEYFGPLLIHPLLYFNQSIFYGQEAPKTVIQTTMFWMVILHFIKREYETIFVHRFSNSTMPLRNLPKNCFHYWVFSGIGLAYWVYQPGFNGGLLGGVTSDIGVLVLIAIYVYAEVSNYITHVILSQLRPPGSRVRKIPHGYGFNLVTCPNYFFECLAWFTVAILTGSVAAWVFLSISFGQMYIWAVKKHKRYIKDFGAQYPKRRKICNGEEAVPGILTKSRHYGEDPSTEWGPEQDRNSTRVIETIIDVESPDFVVLLGDQVTGENVQRFECI